MNDSSEKNEALILELHDLITARLNEDISREQVERLEYLVINDPVARKLYVKYMQDTVSLQWWAQSSSNCDSETSALLAGLRESLLAIRLDDDQTAAAEQPQTAEHSNQIPFINQTVEEFPSAEESESDGKINYTRRIGKYGPYAAAILIMLSLITVFQMMTGSSSTAIATLTSSTRAHWLDQDGNKLVLQHGAELTPRELTLQRGLAKLTFSNNVVAVLDARKTPARIELKSNSQFHLHQGRVNLLNDTHGEHSFTVDLPHQRKVVDVGTEFGLIVDQAQHAEVHVFDGIVDYKRLDDKGEVVGELRLNEKEQIESTPEGEVTPIEAAPRDEFILAEDFNQFAENLTRQTKDGYLMVESYRFPDEEGKPLKWYRKNYPDSGYELIDGVVGENQFQDSAWVGWADGRTRNTPDSFVPQPRIEFELSHTSKIAAVEIVYLQTGKGAVYAPNNVNVYVSKRADFKSTTLRTQSDDFVDHEQPRGVYTTKIDLKNAEGKFIRMDFYNDQNWTFLGEIRFIPAK